jgi:hypothetical protein
MVFPLLPPIVIALVLDEVVAGCVVAVDKLPKSAALPLEANSIDSTKSVFPPSYPPALSARVLEEPPR